MENSAPNRLPLDIRVFICLYTDSIACSSQKGLTGYAQLFNCMLRQETAPPKVIAKPLTSKEGSPKANSNIEAIAGITPSLSNRWTEFRGMVRGFQRSILLGFY